MHLTPIKAHPRLLSMGEHLPQRHPKHPGIRRMRETARLQRLGGAPGGRREKNEHEQCHSRGLESGYKPNGAFLTKEKGFCVPPPWCTGQCELAAPSSGQSLQSSPCRWWRAGHCGQPDLYGGNASAPGRPSHTPPEHAHMVFMYFTCVLIFIVLKLQSKNSPLCWRHCPIYNKQFHKAEHSCFSQLM